MRTAAMAGLPRAAPPVGLLSATAIVSSPSTSASSITFQTLGARHVLYHAAILAARLGRTTAVALRYATKVIHLSQLERARAAGAVAPAPAVAALVEAQRFPRTPARDVGVEVAPGGEEGGQEGVANPGFPDRVEPLAAAGSQPEDDRVRRWQVRYRFPAAAPALGALDALALALCAAVNLDDLASAALQRQAAACSLRW
ncbi:MAG: hypothetical protein RMJ48_10760 [Roseiflexaceae bacterium]|nr:hypothetical protein [Roseiflexaceae bacterium]